MSLDAVWVHEHALPLARPEASVEDRLDALEQRVEVYRAEVYRDLDARLSSASGHLQARVGDVDKRLSARLTTLRDLVIGTADGGRRAYAAVALLVGGLMLQAMANVLAIV